MFENKEETEKALIIVTLLIVMFLLACCSGLIPALTQTLKQITDAFSVRGGL